MWAEFRGLKSAQIRSSKAKAVRNKKRPMDVFVEWMDEGWLQSVRHEARLLSGEAVNLSDGEREKYGHLHSKWRDRVSMQFDDCCPKEVGLDEDIVLVVHVKNVTAVRMKIFEINTRSYFRDKQRELKTDLNLDGLEAKYEREIGPEELDLKRFVID